MLSDTTAAAAAAAAAACFLLLMHKPATVTHAAYLGLPTARTRQGIQKNTNQTMFHVD
jgi:hypothetical protein